MQYRFRISLNDGVYVAECLDFPECRVENTNLFELKKEIKKKMADNLNKTVFDSDIFPVYTRDVILSTVH